MSHTTRESDSPTQHESGLDDALSHHGSLRSKLVLSLAGIFLVFLMIDELVRQQVIEPEFVALEEAGAIRDANRVLAAMNAEVEHLNDLAKQWATRNQVAGTHRLESTRGESAGETTSSIGPRAQTWPVDTVDWAASTAPDGSWRWHRRGPQGTPLSADIDNYLRSLVAICSRSGSPSSSGMTRIGSHSLVMFAVIQLGPPQPDSLADDSSDGYLVIARQIDEAMVTALRRQTQVEFSLQSPRTSDPSQRLVVWAADESTLVVDVQLTGMNDQKLANVHIQVPRDITARSHRTTVLARNSFIFGSVAALLMLLLLLQRIVIGPLTAIREHSDRIAEEGLATEPLVLPRNDEIGQLARAFDKMVSRLSDTQDELTRASQAAGRSQVASTVIHNVGNVLTNVNSLLDAASDRTQGLRIAPLDKLASRLKQAGGDDGLLAATPDYLEGLAGSLKSDQQLISELLSTLNDNIRHIHDVIRAQQRHTDRTVKAASVKLKNIIDEAIACCRARLEQDCVSVTISGKLSIEVETDRSLLLQTMINVIGNAGHAMRDNEGDSRMLAIDVKPVHASVRISFCDNGCGMTDQTIDKVFDAHFTTRESGTGLGLHFCSITLKRLGGSIRATSAGPGKGSTFVIELPKVKTTIADKSLTENLSPALSVGASS